MSDAAITTIVSGFVQVVVLVVGFLTLWVKLKYGVEKAERSATAAATKAHEVEQKLDANTVTTQAVSDKADTIVSQTNGTMDQLRMIVAKIAERVDKLEEYNHTSAHRLLNAINAVHLKVAELFAGQGKNPLAPDPKTQ